MDKAPPRKLFGVDRSRPREPQSSQPWRLREEQRGGSQKKDPLRKHPRKKRPIFFSAASETHQYQLQTMLARSFLSFAVFPSPGSTLQEQKGSNERGEEREQKGEWDNTAQVHPHLFPSMVFLTWGNHKLGTRKSSELNEKQKFWN